MAGQIETQKEAQSKLLLEAIQRQLGAAGAGTIESITGTYDGKDTIHYLGNVFFPDGIDPQSITNVRQKIANFCDIQENGLYAFAVTQVVKIGQEIKVN